MTRKELEALLSPHYSECGIKKLLSSETDIVLKIAYRLEKYHGVPLGIWGKENRGKLLAFLGERKRRKNDNN